MNYTFITFFHSHTKTLNQKFRLKYCYIGTTIRRDNHQGCVAASCTVAGLFFGSEERPESREERLLAAIKGYRGSPTVRSLTSKICVFLSFRRLTQSGTTQLVIQDLSRRLSNESLCIAYLQ